MRKKTQKLICGKCRTEQDMKRIKIIPDKKSNNQKECFTWWCPNCKDQIANSAVIRNG